MKKLILVLIVILAILAGIDGYLLHKINELSNDMNYIWEQTNL